MLTLSFARFNIHLLASSAILEKRPMGVSLIMLLSLHAFLGINHLKDVSLLQAITSVRVSTTRLTKATWRTVGLLLTMKESARRPVKIYAAAGRSQRTCYFTRDMSRRAVVQGLGTKHKHWGQILFGKKATTVAPSTGEEVDASCHLYKPDTLQRLCNVILLGEVTESCK